MEEFCPATTKNKSTETVLPSRHFQQVSQDGLWKSYTGKRAAVGPRRTRYSWIGTPGSQPPETEEAQVGESTGDSRSL